MGIKLIPACHFPFIFGMVFALNMSNPTRTGLRQCFLKRQTWTWTHKTHKFIYWFHESGGIKLKALQEKCCTFAPALLLQDLDTMGHLNLLLYHVRCYLFQLVVDFSHRKIKSNKSNENNTHTQLYNKYIRYMASDSIWCLKMYE